MTNELLFMTVELWLEYQAAKRQPGGLLSHDVKQLKEQLDKLILNLSSVIDGDKVRAARNAD